MSADPDSGTEPDSGAEPLQVQDSASYVDARQAMGVQVGADNTQIIYNYSRLTWADGVPQPPLVSVSGKVDSPYRGLRAFEERDAPFFFGREAAAADVLGRMSKRVAGTGLLVVSGVSGAGKSSLLRAGVLPRIRGVGLAAAPEATRWPCLLLTPGPGPLDVLAVQVAHLAGIGAAAVRRGLDDDPVSFALAARQAALAQLGGSPGDPGTPLLTGVSRPPGAPRLLLVIDQFEQVFTQCLDEKQRQAFITALGAAVTRDSPEQDPAALIVLGVRADFEARCADYPQLADAIQDRYLVTSMAGRQLRMAITEPAKKAGSSVDDDLVDVLLEEMGTRQPTSSAVVPGGRPTGGAGILPLLSHALDQAWRTRAGDVLTLADYERAGGIEGAVADSAQRVYDGLTPAQQAAARQIFIRLTATTSDNVDTASRANRAELTEGRDASQARDIETVLEAFAAERLLTLAAGTVEISHDVLLTAWPLLRDTWLAQTHGDRIVRTRLHNAAADWDRHARDSSYLYTGSLLEDAVATAARISADPVRYPPLGRTERDFIQAGQRARRRRVRWLRGVTAFLLVLVVGFASAAFLAARANLETAQARDAAAVSGQLIAQSEALGDNDPLTAKRESLAAWQVDPSSPAARYALLTAARLPGTGLLKGDGAPVNAVAYSPDGKILATGAANGIVWLWDVGTQQQIPGPLDTSGNTRAINSVAFSPDGRLVAAAGVDGIVRLWDVATHQPTGPPLVGDVSAINSIAISPHGQLLAAGHSDGIVQLWDTASGQLAGGSITPQAGVVQSVAFSPDGTMLVTGSRTTGDQGTVRLWRVSSRQPIGAPLGDSGFAEIGPAYSVAFSPDGTMVAATTSSSVDVWDATSRRHITYLFAQNNGSPITSVAFSPDSRFVAAGDQQGEAQLWDVTTEQPIGIPLTADSIPVNSVAFSPDGKTLATGDHDGTARLWNAATRRQLGRPLIGDRARTPVISVAFSPDGKTLATGDLGGTARLWDVATGQQIGASLVTHDGTIWSVAFSPDGKTLAGGYGNGVVQLWDMRYLTNAVSFLCARIGSFTPTEWKAHVPGLAYQKTCP